jgi:hypothetical protein
MFPIIQIMLTGTGQSGISAAVTIAFHVDFRRIPSIMFVIHI